MSFESLLNKICVLQKKTEIQDVDSGEMIETWANFITEIHCRLDMARGGELRNPNDILYKATHVLYTNYDFRGNINWKDYRIIIEVKHG